MGASLSDYLGRVTITDGGWGTQLQLAGLAPGACPDELNASNPAAVEAVARSYVQAGSRIILTNTFSSNRVSLAKYGLEARAADLSERGAAISRRAAGRDVKVFGSIGPSGKIVMMGQAAPEELTEAFAAQAAALERGGCDALVCESFAELEEIVLAIRAACQATKLPVVASMTFDSGPDKTSTMMGNAPAEVAAAAASAGAAAIGANCGVGPEVLVKVTALLRVATALPIWMKPNAGLPVVQQGKTSFPMGPAEFTAFARQFASAGANFLGGCCGTNPEHIKALCQAV